MTVFDAYVMVDWSAAAHPATGADSIWIAVRERDGNRLVECPPANPPTREAASAMLADLLSDLSARGCRTLLGFDFSFGYPAGLAARLDARRPDWKGVWRRLAAEVRDAQDNANNRFEAAARLNGAISGRGFPFWGCPTGGATDLLGAKKPEGFARTSSPAGTDPLGFHELRLCERQAKGAQSSWKLYGAGSVGGQSLLGIPRLLALRNHPWLKDCLRIWPFETGLGALERPAAGTIILAEVYPSLIDVPPGTVKDAAQVAALCRHFSDLDEAGRLGRLFIGDGSLTEAERALVEAEEGWILGVDGNASRPADDYLRDPAAIYEQSFAIIRREADLSRFTGLVGEVAVRVIHACGMPEVAADLSFSVGAAEAGRLALASGKPILVDVQMVAHGITRRLLPAANPVLCFLDDPRTRGLASLHGTTRSAAAVELWREHLDGAVVAIGNAPTALFHLLAMLEAGAPRPAVILGFPVGFVGAVEAKQALAASGFPHISLLGRRGGSAMAAAAVNALALGEGKGA